MNRRICLLAVAAAFSALIGCSDNKKPTAVQTGYISGTVTIDGVGVPGVTITVYNLVEGGGTAKMENPLNEAGSAADGDFYITVLPGTYRIEFDYRQEYDALHTARYPLNVVPESGITVNVDLKDPIPANLIVADRNAAVVLTWEHAYAAQGYNIYRSPASEDNYQLIDSYGYGFGTLTYFDRPPEVAVYDYRVTGVSSDGESDPSNIAQVSFTATIDPPANLTSVDRAVDVYLQWQRNPNATGYKVYRRSGSGSWNEIATRSANDYADIPQSYAVYDYYVVAISDYGTESQPSNIASVDFDGLCDPPSNLTLVDRGSVVYLTWTDQAGGICYKIYRSLQPDDDYARIDTSLERSYSDRPPAYNTFYYRVSTVGLNGLESTPSNAVSVHYDGRLEPPAGVSGHDMGLYVYLSWDLVPWAGAYIIYRSDDGGETYHQVGRASSTSPHFMDTPPTPGQYYYRVSTETIEGVEGSLSFPVSIQFSANLLPPSMIVATDYGLYVSMRWENVSGATGYSVFRAPSPNGDYIEVEDSVYSVEFTDSPPSAGHYYYRVQAFDNQNHRSQMSDYAYVYYSDMPRPPSIYSVSDDIYRTVVYYYPMAYIDSVIIYRSNSIDGDFLPRDTIPGEYNYYYDYPPTAGHYFYKLRGFAENRLSDFSDYGHVYFTGRLDAPQNLTGYDAGNYVRLAWSLVNGASSYDVYRGNTPDDLILVVTVYTDTATDTPDQAGTYYYAVVARTVGGLESPMTSPIAVDFTP